MREPEPARRKAGFLFALQSGRIAGYVLPVCILPRGVISYLYWVVSLNLGDKNET